MKKIFKSNGSLFVTVILISMIMIFIAVAGTNMLMQDVHMVKHLKKTTAAQYIAEAGISDAFATLVENGFTALDTNFPLQDSSFAGGSYNVTVTRSSGRILLVSVGNYESISRTVSVEIEDNTASALYYMMAAGTDLRLRAFFFGLADINGDLHANDDVTLRAQALALIDVDTCGSSCCDGNVTACNRIFESAGMLGLINIHGSVAEGVAPVSFPQFDYVSYKALAQGSGDYHSGDTDFGSIGATTNLNPGNGIIYVDGTATFYGRCNLMGGVIADKLLIRGRLSQYKDGTKNVIIAKGSDSGSTKGDIKIFYWLEAEEAVVYAARDFAVVSAFSVVTVTGALLASRNIRIWDMLSYVTYNHRLLHPDGILGPNGESDPINVISWTR